MYCSFGEALSDSVVYDCSAAARLEPVSVVSVENVVSSSEMLTSFLHEDDQVDINAYQCMLAVCVIFLL